MLHKWSRKIFPKLISHLSWFRDENIFRDYCTRRCCQRRVSRDTVLTNCIKKKLKRMDIRKIIFLSAGMAEYENHAIWRYLWKYLLQKDLFQNDFHFREVHGKKWKCYFKNPFKDPWNTKMGNKLINFNQLLPRY